MITIYSNIKFKQSMLKAITTRRVLIMILRAENHNVGEQTRSLKPLRFGLEKLMFSGTILMEFGRNFLKSRLQLLNLRILCALRFLMFLNPFQPSKTRIKH